ncbi:MAG: hypothetical protein AAFP28_12025 [Pseudomonadota bacterium]
MGIAAIAQGVSIVSGLASLLASEDGEEEKNEDKIYTYGAGAYIENHSKHTFHQINGTGGLYTGDDMDDPEFAHWLETPEGQIGPDQIMTCGYGDRYMNDDEVDIETCLGYFSPTSPVAGLGIMALMWFEIRRDDDDDAPITYRAGALSVWVDSNMTIKDKNFAQTLSRLYHRRKSLFLEGKPTIPPSYDSFAYSKGTNSVSKGYYINTVKKTARLAAHEKNYCCKISVQAGKETRFDLSIEATRYQTPS